MSSSFDRAIYRGIAAERYRQQMTQKQLGERLRMSERTVMEIEGGDRTVAAHELVDICRALGVTLDQLLIAATTEERKTLGLRPVD